MEVVLKDTMEKIEIQLWKTIYKQLEAKYKPFIYLGDDRLPGGFNKLIGLVGERGNYVKNYGI